jgi:hypothetical protein
MINDEQRMAKRPEPGVEILEPIPQHLFVLNSSFMLHHS